MSCTTIRVSWQCALTLGSYGGSDLTCTASNIVDSEINFKTSFLYEHSVINRRNDYFIWIILILNHQGEMGSWFDLGTVTRNN